MRRVFIIFLIISALVAPIPTGYAQDGTNKSAPKKPVRSGWRSTAEGITTAQLRDYLTFVAADELEGRDTPSRGLNITAKFIATLLARWGVKPAGDDGTYFQKIAMGRAKIDATTTRVEINGQRLTYGEDFLATPRSGTGSAPLVFVGHGWMVKSKNIDPYNDVDIKNKIVIVTGDRPKVDLTMKDFEGKRGEDWAEPATYAQKMGAIGIIELPNEQNLANWGQLLQRQKAGGSLSVTKLKNDEGGKLPEVTLSVKSTNALFQGESQSGAQILESLKGNTPIASFALNPNKTVSFTVTGQEESIYTQNVIGVIEGSDAVLKKEHVAVGAHYDHVGTGPAGSNGRAASRDGNKSDIIYNGADDDGSGTVSLLAMAEALTRAPRRPKRSVLFVWHCGEEKGLWGSEYFAKYPTVPIDQIVAQFNIDMIGRSKKEGDTKAFNKFLTGPNEIYVIGSKMMSTELGKLSERVNESYLKLSFNYLYDDPNDTNRFFFRSDHFNYAAKGIPIIFYFDGVHEDYHRPSDEVHAIDFDKMQRVARTVFVTLLETADLKSRPLVDKKLPPELTEQ